MLKHLRLFALLSLGLPLSAHSSLYTFEYDGYIAYLNGNGLGYGDGQHVSGALTFDLANSSGDNYPSSFIVGYGAKIGANVDFVAGYLPSSAGTGPRADTVYAYDSIDGAHVLPDAGGFRISDGRYTDTSLTESHGLGINISFDNFDWLTGDGKLNEFSFDANDFLGTNNNIGNFYELKRYTTPDGHTDFINNTASFKLNSAKLTLAEVPEPSPLLLMLCGGFMLCLTRRFNFRINLSYPNNQTKKSC